MPAGHAISALEWELLAYFEAEPDVRHPDLDWPYNSYVYRTQVDDLDVSFSVAPAYKDFTLTVRRRGAKHIEFTALDLVDIIYHAEGGEWLELMLSESLSFELRLRPVFSFVGRRRPQAQPPAAVDRPRR